MNDTVADLLRARAGDTWPALLFEAERYSWAELVAAAAARATAALEWQRSGPFHIGVLLDNTPEYLYWIAGAALCGATVVGINPTRRGSELASDIRHTDCQLIITDAGHSALLDGLDTGVAQERIMLADSPAYAGSIARYAGSGPPDVDIQPSDRLLLLFTSGSTGAPKAVICSQGRLTRIAARTPGMFGITRETVTYQAMPLFHGNALMTNWAPVLATGATMSMRRRFSATGFLPDVRRFGASFFNYVGRSLAYVLATPEQEGDDLNPLRLGFGTEASARDMDEFVRRFGCRLLESYGSSEGAISTHKPSGAPPSSIGTAQPDADLAIVDPYTAVECPRARFDEHGALLNADAAIGEIVGRNAAHAFEGYYNNTDADAERTRQGWYWSGDLGYRDEDGWFYFAGRGADRLRVDSENFGAAPIEHIVSRWPGAVMVAVYPVPDPRTGDQVMAAIELSPGTSFDPIAFGDFLNRQPDLGIKWMPRFVRIVSEMPLTASNKVQKQVLRKEQWSTMDPVYWRPAHGAPYEVLTAAHVDGLRLEALEHGRLAVPG